MVFATLGTCLPIIGGIGVAHVLGYEILYEGLAAGVSLAPTSVGIALKLLLETRQLQTDFGQAIITGAFVDDILSLIAYGILLNIETAVLPGLLGIVFLIVGAIVAAKVFPVAVPKL